jgi:COP9 signalosome complex subunit 4
MAIGTPLQFSIFSTQILTVSSATSEQDKFQIYVRIVRLLLEEEDSTQAEMYYNRAALLVHHNKDRSFGLMFRLSQAKIHDYTRKFLEAAMRYHELSWEADIDEGDRLQMLCVSIYLLPLPL